MCHKTELKHFRTLTGPDRKSAMRYHLTKYSGVDFAADVHSVPVSALNDVAAMAKAVCWRKSVASSMSLGAAFFTYLARDVAQPVSGPARQAAQAKTRGPGIAFGRGFAS